MDVLGCIANLLTLYSIIAIHGIGADPDRTWTGRGPADEEVNWLMSPEMLPKAVPNARIMRFGYQSNWFGTIMDEPKKTFISDVADMLLKQIEFYRRVLQSSPPLSIFIFSTKT